ncbi:MAG: hypothetical protein B6D64_10600 [Bacteroidetes bacterium 4484_276]|nr:MAG: hypothetical protein B6D64_10600 [Bacteroidetes bacterium 4484_276]
MKQYSVIILAAITILLLSTGFYLRERNPGTEKGPQVIGLETEIPKSYSNLFTDEFGKLYFGHPETGVRYYAGDIPEFRYEEFQIDPVGYDLGMTFDFNAPGFNGTIYYGLIKEDGVDFPQPVFFGKPAFIQDGKAVIPITDLRGKYDFTNWAETGNTLLGYRIVYEDGSIIYDSRVRMKGKVPFKTNLTIIDGPYLNILRPNSAVISPFTFAFASDSRAGKGGGERNIYGANAYIIKKMAALALFEGAGFVQFTGDMINGYTTHRQYNLLQYQNFKHAIEPFAHRIPFVIAMGNHEALTYNFMEGDKTRASIDKFPWESESAEAVFSEVVVNPVSGLKSEDGSKYDPGPKTIDFPSYSESVFYYTYHNVAMVVLNSNYWYAPDSKMVKFTSGNIHGYIMDNQLEWLKNTINKLENDDGIDHIFVTVHTPAFPNGGHSNNDMWYGGNNGMRPYIAGRPVEKGIIERRDELLDIMINKSKKTVALLCGDEHNYNRMRITDGMPMYPPDWPYEKLKISRTFWQLTNGSAGAPYYAQEQLIWSDNVEKFSTQYALIFFNVDGKNIKIK